MISEFIICAMHQLTEVMITFNCSCDSNFELQLIKQITKYSYLNNEFINVFCAYFICVNEIPSFDVGLEAMNVHVYKP